MALSDHLKSTVKRDQVEVLLELMDPEDAETLREAIQERDHYTGGDIARALQAEGYEITAMQINHHRRKKA